MQIWQGILFGGHIKTGALNNVAFWQTACQSWSVHGEGTRSSGKCSEAASLLRGWNLLGVLEDCAASRTVRHLRTMSSSGCSLTRVGLLSTVVAKSVTRNCSFLPSRGRDKLMRQLSEISLKLKPFQESCEFTSAANQQREKAAVFLSLCNSNDLITLSIMSLCTFRNGSHNKGNFLGKLYICHLWWTRHNFLKLWWNVFMCFDQYAPKPSNAACLSKLFSFSRFLESSEITDSPHALLQFSVWRFTSADSNPSED